MDYKNFDYSTATPEEIEQYENYLELGRDIKRRSAEAFQHKMETIRREADKRYKREGRGFRICTIILSILSTLCLLFTFLTQARLGGKYIVGMQVPISSDCYLIIAFATLPLAIASLIFGGCASRRRRASYMVVFKVLAILDIIWFVLMVLFAR